VRSMGNAPKNDPPLDSLRVHANVCGHIRDGEPCTGDALRSRSFATESSRRRYRDVESATEVNNKLVWGVTKNYERRSARLPRFLCEQVGRLSGRPAARTRRSRLYDAPGWAAAGAEVR
jgi:hypothetical protein